MIWHFDSTLYKSIKHQVGTRALIQAQEIASDPELIEQVKNRDIQAIKPHIERLAKISDASFIVIGDKMAFALPTRSITSRPPDARGDNAGALERGESYVTLREGSLGYGIRGKTPILDSQQRIIGVVSVGYLLNRFDQWLDVYMQPLLLEVLIIFILTLLASWAFSRHIQNK